MTNGWSSRAQQFLRDGPGLFDMMPGGGLGLVGVARLEASMIAVISAIAGSRRLLELMVIERS